MTSVIWYPAVAYPGFQREGCLRSGPIQKVGGGGGGASGPIYEKWGGGGGGGRFRSDIHSCGNHLRNAGREFYLYWLHRLKQPMRSRHLVALLSIFGSALKST